MSRYKPIGNSKKKKFETRKIVVAVTLIIIITAFNFLFQHLFSQFILNRYDEALFSYVPYFRICCDFMLIICSAWIIVETIKDISGKFKKVTRIVSIALCVITTFTLCNKIYVFNNTSVTRYNIFGKARTTYLYEENIKKADLYVLSTGVYFRGISLTYSINFDDGSKTKLILNDVFTNDYNNSVEFDKAISDFRTVNADYDSVEMIFYSFDLITDDTKEYYLDLALNHQKNT